MNPQPEYTHVGNKTHSPMHLNVMSDPYLQTLRFLMKETHHIRNLLEQLIASTTSLPPLQIPEQVPNFVGIESFPQVLQFLKCIHCLATERNQVDTDARYLLSLGLKDRALNWYQYNKDFLLTWDQIKRAMFKRFTLLKKDDDIVKFILEAFPEPGETYFDWVVDRVFLFDMLDKKLDEATKVLHLRCAYYQQTGRGLSDCQTVEQVVSKIESEIASQVL